MIRHLKVRRPRLSRCGRGCRKIGLDEMVHAHPEKLSHSRAQKRLAA